MRRKSVSGAFFVISQALVTYLVSVPATLYIMRAIGDYNWGAWSTSLGLILGSAIFWNIGLRAIFIRHIALHPEERADDLAIQLGLRMLLSTIAALVAIAVGFAERFEPVILECVAISGVGMVMQAAAGALTDVLQSDEKFRTFAAMNLVAGLALTAASVIVVRVGWGPIGMACAYVLGPFLLVLQATYVVGKSGTPVRMAFSIAKYRAVLYEVRHVAAQQVFIILQKNVELLLIPRAVSITMAGVFSKGVLLPDRLDTVPDGLATAAYPRISKTFDLDQDEARAEVRRLLMMSLIVCVPLAVLVGFWAGPIARILTKDYPELCAQLMIISIWYVPCRALATSFLYSLQASGHYSQAAKIVMWATILGIACSSTLILKAGLKGAAWAWVIKPLIVCLMLLPFFARTYPTVLRRTPILQVMIAAAAMGLVFLIFLKLPLRYLIVLPLGTAACLSIYLVALMAMKVLSPKELSRLMRRRSPASE